MYDINDFYTAMMSVSSISMFILLVIVRRSNTLNKERKLLFTLIFLFVQVAGACEWLGVILDGYGGFWKYLHIFVKYLEFTLTPTIPVLFCWIIKKKFVRSAITLIVIHAIIEFFNMFFGYIFYIDSNNIYHHAELYWIYVLAYSASTVFGLAFSLINTKKYQFNGFGIHLMIAIMIVLDAGIALATSTIRIIFIGLGMSASILYITILEMILQTDGLTELLSRTSFENYVASHRKKCMIIFFDVDSFKYINDNYGHEYGDLVLKCIGNAVRENYVSYGKCYRYGGDEFCVILRKNLENTKALNASFSARIENLRKEDSRIPYVSIGYAEFEPKSQTMQDVLDEADKKMYEAKRKRKSGLA